ncbi:MAG TPA: OmpA family protein [Pseudomonadales bacterium]|nr:OmpA family protein [Pseudomonadales bacterium]
MSKTKNRTSKLAWVSAGAVCAATALATLPSHAADDRIYISPTIYRAMLDSGRSYDSDYAGQIQIGKALSDSINVEGYLDYGKFDRESSTGKDLKQTGLGLDALYFFNRSSIAPYLLVGAGAVKSSGAYPAAPTVGQSSTDFAFNFGAGILWQVMDNGTAIRTELRTRSVDDGLEGETSPVGDRGSRTRWDTFAGIGLTIPLGSKPAPAAEPVAEPTPPPPPPVVDTDSDGDGVVDRLDQCPGTPAGAKVDSTGCLVAQVLLLKDVNFEFNSAKLTSESKIILDQAAAALKKTPGKKVEVAGHTDAVGSNTYNMKLSQARAKSVRDYLIAQGVDAARLTSAGYGEEKPVADNGSDEGRAKNRRVELHIKD